MLDDGCTRLASHTCTAGLETMPILLSWCGRVAIVGGAYTVYHLGTCFFN